MIVSIPDHDFLLLINLRVGGGGYHSIGFADERKGGSYKVQNIFATDFKHIYHDLD